MKYDIENLYSKLKDTYTVSDVVVDKTDGIFYPGRLYYIERNLDTKKMYNRQMFCLCISSDIQKGQSIFVDLCKIEVTKRLKFLSVIISTCYRQLSEELESILGNITGVYVPEINKASTLRIFSNIFDMKKSIKKINIRGISYVGDICWADVYKIIDLCDKSVIANGNIVQYQTL